MERRPFPLLSVDPKIEEQLGRVLIAFSRLEASISMLFDDFLGLPEEEHGLITGALNFGTLVDLFEAMVNRRLRDKTPSRLKRLSRSLREVEAERNVLVHSVWGFHSEGAHLLWNTTKRGRGPTEVLNIDAKYLNELALRITRLDDDLETLALDVETIQDSLRAT